MTTNHDLFIARSIVFNKNPLNKDVETYEIPLEETKYGGAEEPEDTREN